MPVIAIAAGGVVIAVFLLESYWHRKSRNKIGIRIHVNGIRGKSSVVRLIAAGLRRGGIRTWAKVTGTLPAVIPESGEDVPIIRGGPSSIIEQRAVIAEAATAGAQALVLECMALEPAFQRAEENLFRPTIGVITNVRLDHAEVVGSSRLDVSLALSNTAPRDGVLITTAGEAVSVLRAAASRRGSSTVVVETAELPDSLTDGFSYFKHSENVALALAVCENAGVPREVALAAMRECPGDPGALRICSLSEGDKTIHWVGGFAANDPESTMLLFERAVLRIQGPGELLVLVNSRKDRPLRSKQLGQLLIALPAERYLLIGTDSQSVRREAAGAGVADEAIKVIDEEPAAEVVAQIFAEAGQVATVFAIGNTAGLGLEINDHFLKLGTALRLGESQ